MRTKTCKKCSIDRPASEFWASSKSPDGLQYWCKECHRSHQRQWNEKNQDKIREYRKKHRVIRRERYATDEDYRERILLQVKRFRESLPQEERRRRDRSGMLRAKYGLESDQVEEMWNEQGRKCSICKREAAVPDVDHDHVTGRIRGLLCGKCNRALGHFGDNIDGLMSAVRYLERAETRFA